MTIPVTDPKFWSGPRIAGALSETLLALMGDVFTFDFVPQMERTMQTLNLLAQGENRLPAKTRVILASGGLDSFTRIVESMTQDDDPTVAVTLTGRPRLDGHRDRLYQAIRPKIDAPRFYDIVLRCVRHGCNREFTARSRPFLIYTLGAAMASALGASRFEVPENGIVAVNLALAGDATMNRVSRTAHPETRRMMSDLFEMVTEERIVVDNPYEELTREEVIARLGRCQRLDLIGLTVACSRANPGERLDGDDDGSDDDADVDGQTPSPMGSPHPAGSTKVTHCGRCTQCVDRRIAILSGGWERFDPIDRYAVDPVHGNGSAAGSEAATLQDYVATSALWGDTTGYREFMIALSPRGAQLADAVRCSALLWDCSVDEAGERLWKLHQRHGQRVATLYHRMHEKLWIKGLRGELPLDSIITLVAGQISKPHGPLSAAYLPRGALAARAYSPADSG